MGSTRNKKRPKTRLSKRLSREQGTIAKDWGGRLPVALIYPNSYYLGMSNLGIHAIYGLLNSRRNIVCERVFWEKENKEERKLGRWCSKQRNGDKSGELSPERTKSLETIPGWYWIRVNTRNVK